VNLVAHDASGLSYRNRISTRGMVRLLGAAEKAHWGRTLRASLAAPGQGTLENRLAGVGVRARTGTLD
jgi:D-alanyl-D-alanine carboxypeptidase